MNFNDIFSSLINIYQNTCGSRLEDNQAEEIICALLSVRDSERLLQSSPCHLLQVVFENKDFYNKTVYPCDTIGLRNILANKKISSLSKIIAFSNSCSDRIIKDQKLRIFINLDPEKIAKKNNCQVKIYGGMAIFDTNCLDISDCIDCIVTEGGGYEHIRIVQGIVAETETGCPVYTTSFIPGVDKYKFAGSLNEYEINLPSLGIFKEKCRAQTPLEALKIALAIRWNRHPDRKMYKRKPENYNAEFWANSGFFDSIVRPYGKKAILANNSKFAQMKISLTPQEQNIFNSILSVAKAFNLKTQFRVAGGWIRDKILGKSSDDIDIALDDLTGRQFYDYCSRYAKENPNSDIGKNFGKSYVVEQNVEKSKHLETVAIEIGGSKIDFVNLRSESYGENSRIPTVEFGNPETDAKRRDLTINALFYNINTGQIEDYVGGLQDLKDMILRTPMDPVKTFNDDPLRMLRVLRFYSRYPNAKIEQSVLSAMSRPEVHESYRKKVASERAGPEILKMFGSERPAEAIRLLFSTGLDKAVFDVPETKNLLPLNMNQRNKHHKFNLLEHTLRVVENLDKLMKKRNVSPKDRVNMLLAAVFHDYGKSHPEIGKPKDNDINEYSYVGHEDKSSEIADSILKKIGVPEEDRKFVSLIVKQHMRPHTDNWSNKSIGKFMRDTQIPGNNRNDIWEFVMMHSQADTMAKSEEGDQPDFDLKETHINQMRDYLNRPEPIQLKPLLDGFTLQKMFPGLPLVPREKGQKNYIKYIQDLLLEEQFAGNITNVNQANDFVENIRGEINKMYNTQGKSANWYNKAKIANADSASAFGESGRLPLEGPPSQWSGVKKMIYREPGKSSLVSVGDVFRSKAVGSAFEASKDNIYEVISKAEGFVILKDKNGEKQRVEVAVELPAKFVKV